MPTDVATVGGAGWFQARPDFELVEKKFKINLKRL
jgi:hypothetical protein